MPRGDGTGPKGEGPGTGQGSGRGQGRGDGRGSRPGPGGQCVCQECGARVAHQMGVPCFETKCPECGAAMIRENAGANR